MISINQVEGLVTYQGRSSIAFGFALDFLSLGPKERDILFGFVVRLHNFGLFSIE
jgi:hypothetical protein